MRKPKRSHPHDTSLETVNEVKIPEYDGAARSDNSSLQPRRKL